jgi:hypothetical protein
MNQERGRSTRLPTGAIVGAVFGLGIGLLLGLVYAYVIAPADFASAEPQHLRVDYAVRYWEFVTESYDEHGNLELARTQLGPWTDTEYLQTVLARARIETSPETSMRIQSLAEKIGGDVEPAPQETPIPGQTPLPDANGPGLKWGPIAGVALLVMLLVAVAGLILSRARKSQRTSSGMARGTAGADEPDWLATMHPEGDLQAPAAGLGHFVTSYSLGNDHYDQSFSIETPAGEFLGECGVGISETIGEGTPDHVTAFEVWLFDKNDIRTVTKVLMSEYAYNDTELRDRLAPKGEAVLAQANVPLVLETATLRVTATASEALYSQDDSLLPPNSAFDRLTVELVTQQREEALDASDADTLEEGGGDLDFGV